MSSSSPKESSSEATASVDDRTKDSPVQSFLVLICKDNELELYKAKFSSLFSVHLYSLSAFALENYDVFESLGDKPLVDKEGRTPLDFGPIQCSESQKLLENVPAPVVVNNTVKDVKKPGVAVKDKNDSSEASSKNKNEKEEKKSPEKKSVKPVGEKNDPNRLKNMFATAAAQPKKKVEKVESKTKPQQTEFPRNSSKSSNKSEPKGKANNNDSSNRKRVRDVLSSSESEDEGKNSEDEDSLPESPIPKKKKRMPVIQSDSEDDEAPIPKKKPANDISSYTVETSKPNVEASKPGRKRITKFISETRVDEDGFLVTEKKKVTVSEDEDEDVGEKISSAPAPASKPASSSSTDAKKVTQPSKAASTSKPASGKTKQQSLMSFFQKK